MIKLIRQAPFLRVILPYVLGISLVQILPEALAARIVVFSVILLLGGVCLIFRKSSYYQWLFGIFQQMILFGLGALSIILAEKNNQVSNSGLFNSQEGHFYAQIVAEPEEKEKTIKCEVKISYFIIQGKNAIPEQARAIVYLQKDSQSKSLEYGDQIFCKNKFQAIRNSGNPGAFDYAAYCKRQGIYYSAYVRNDEWQWYSQEVNSFGKTLNQAQKTCRGILKKYITDSSASGMAEALLIGYRKNIDAELWDSYSRTGLAHIIAISGMHMAIFYVGLQRLLMLIPIFARKKRESVILALLGMWMFAILTGLPPSVLRAAVMFTFIGIGACQKREMNVFNNLCASAFCLLLWNPNWLFDIGFQLSYLAVLSLVIFYPPIYQRLSTSNKWANFPLQLISGTLAAQVLTWPLCLYYFHQFPLLFVFSNLIAVPCTTFILYLEIVLVLLSPIQVIASTLGSMTQWLILKLNVVIQFIAQGDWVIWRTGEMYKTELFCWYMLLLMIGVFWKYRNKWAMGGILAVGLYISVIGLMKQWVTLNQHQLVIINDRTNPMLCAVEGQQIKYLLPQVKDNRSEKYVFDPCKMFYQIKEERQALLPKNKYAQMFTWKGKRILRLMQAGFKCEDAIDVDYLILSRDYKGNIHHLKSNFKVANIILEPTLSDYKTRSWHDRLSSAGYQVFAMRWQGAYYF
ncbi:MAG: ComEC/Rec2 family competence protein [Chitinophagaceae bacterium]